MSSSQGGTNRDKSALVVLFVYGMVLLVFMFKNVCFLLTCLLENKTHFLCNRNNSSFFKKKKKGEVVYTPLKLLVFKSP